MGNRRRGEPKERLVNLQCRCRKVAMLTTLLLEWSLK